MLDRKVPHIIAAALRFSQPLWGSPKVAIPFLLLACLLVQVVAHHIFYMRFSVDSPLYIESAAALLQGEFPSHRGKWYMGYIGILAIFKQLNIEPINMIYLQSLVSVWVTYVLYQATYRLSESRIGAFAAASMYILWIELHQWNTIVYTDALFASLTVISLAHLWFARSLSEKAMAALLLMYAMSLRPTGIGLALSVLIYLGFVIRERADWRWNASTKAVLLVVSLAGFLVILNQILYSYIHWFIESYSMAEIIYPKNTLGISPAEDLYIPHAEWPPVVQLAAFIIGNILYFTKLFLVKLFLFLGHIKPYYSTAHNLLIVLILYPIYLLALYGWKKLSSTPIKASILSFLSIQTLIVALTSENWDGRFLLPLLPLVFILAGIQLGVWGDKCQEPK